MHSVCIVLFYTLDTRGRARLLCEADVLRQQRLLPERAEGEGQGCPGPAQNFPSCPEAKEWNHLCHRGNYLSSFAR